MSLIYFPGLLPSCTYRWPITGLFCFQIKVWQVYKYICSIFQITWNALRIYETIHANGTSWSDGHLTLPAPCGKPISHRPNLTTPKPLQYRHNNPLRHLLMLCISNLCKLTKNWSKRTESKMNVRALQILKMMLNNFNFELMRECNMYSQTKRLCCIVLLQHELHAQLCM